MKLSVQTLPDLTGSTLVAAERQLSRAGFLFHKTTSGGYREFRHADGCVVWIRPSGEVVRMGPRVSTPLSQRKYRRRYDQEGNRTEAHATGELLSLKDR